MRIRLADYVANFLVEHGVTDVFSVVGGGAMHLNDALGHNEKLKVTYNHHEQACAIAAEAYARIDNRIAAVCVLGEHESQSGEAADRKSTRLNSSHRSQSRMPSSA